MYWVKFKKKSVNKKKEKKLRLLSGKYASPLKYLKVTSEFIDNK